MQENVSKMLEDAGVKVTLGNARGYRPTVPLPNYDVKLLKVRPCGAPASARRARTRFGTHTPPLRSLKTSWVCSPRARAILGLRGQIG